MNSLVFHKKSPLQKNPYSKRIKCTGCSSSTFRSLPQHEPFRHKSGGYENFVKGLEERSSKLNDLVAVCAEYYDVTASKKFSLEGHIVYIQSVKGESAHIENPHENVSVWAKYRKVRLFKNCIEVAARVEFVDSEAQLENIRVLSDDSENWVKAAERKMKQGYYPPDMYYYD